MSRELVMAGLVFLGSGLGGVLRHVTNRLAFQAGLTGFPVSTFVVNVVGCFAMGVIAGWFIFRGDGAGQDLRLFLTTGILGGFTTFSAFSLDAALLWERGAAGLAVLYVAGSVVLALAGVFAGLSLMRALSA